MNIIQFNKDVFDKHDFLDYIKAKYKPIKDQYIMIALNSVQMINATLLDTVFFNMVQLALMSGYQYIMIVL